VNDVRAATVQFNHETADKAYNLGRIRAFVDAAARQDVQLLVFPEMCITGYWALRTAAREELARLAGLLDLCTGQRWLRGRRPELYAPLTARTGPKLDPRSARFSTT